MNRAEINAFEVFGSTCYSAPDSMDILEMIELQEKENEK